MGAKITHDNPNYLVIKGTLGIAQNINAQQCNKPGQEKAHLTLRTDPPRI